MQIPTFFIGSVAWSHWLSSKATFSIGDKPALKVLSNLTSSGWLWQPEVLKIYNTCGKTVLEQLQNVFSMKERQTTNLPFRDRQRSS